MIQEEIEEVERVAWTWTDDPLRVEQMVQAYLRGQVDRMILDTLTTPEEWNVT